MPEISRNKRPNQRASSTSAIAEAVADNLPSENTAAAPIDYGITEGARSYGAGSSQAATAKPVGEPVGSPSYFGRSQHTGEGSSPSQGSSRDAAERAFTISRSVVGEPPGSDSYFGGTRPAAGSPVGGSARGAQALSTPTANTVSIGHPPGSPAYYGAAAEQPSRGTIAATTTHPSSTPAATQAQSFAPVGTPPGTPAYTGTMKRK
jgi:hypothetical protein